MDKTISISIGGFAFVLDEIAYNKLKIYLQDVRNSLRGTEGIEDIIEDVEYYAKLSEIPCHIYDGTSVHLGSVCGKPFTVATLIVNDPGDSTILDDLR